MPPLAERVDEAGRARQIQQRRGVDEPDVGGVVPRDRLGRRIDQGAGEVDDVELDLAAGDANLPDDRADPDLEPGLLADLPDHGCLRRLTWLDPAAGQGPSAAVRVVAALDHQQAARRVVHERADAGDDRQRLALGRPVGHHARQATQPAPAATPHLLCGVGRMRCA